MPFTTAELGEWVKGLGLPDDKQKIVLESLGAEGVVQKVGDSILAQKDYSRRMDEVKATEVRVKTEYEKRVADEDKFHGSVAAWKAGKEKEYNAAVEARQQAEAALTAAREKSKALAVTYAIPESELNGIFTGAPERHDPPNRRDEPPRGDDGKFVSTEAFNTTMQDAALIPAILASIDREHGKLFPDRPVDLISLVKAAQKNNRSLQAEWENQFEVPARRAAVATEARTKELDAARKEAAEQERSRLLAEHPELGSKVRSDRMQHQGSPVLEAARKAAEATRKAQEGPPEPSPTRGIEAAIAAWNTGKYDANRNAA